MPEGRRNIGDITGFTSSNVYVDEATQRWRRSPSPIVPSASFKLFSCNIPDAAARDNERAMFVRVAKYFGLDPQESDFGARKFPLIVEGAVKGMLYLSIPFNSIEHVADTCATGSILKRRSIDLFIDVKNSVVFAMTHGWSGNDDPFNLPCKAAINNPSHPLECFLIDLVIKMNFESSKVADNLEAITQNFSSRAGAISRRLVSNSPQSCAELSPSLGRLHAEITTMLPTYEEAAELFRQMASIVHRLKRAGIIRENSHGHSGSGNARPSAAIEGREFLDEVISARAERNSDRGNTLLERYQRVMGTIRTIQEAVDNLLAERQNELETQSIKEFRVRGELYKALGILFGSIGVAAAFGSGGSEMAQVLPMLNIFKDPTPWIRGTVLVSYPLSFLSMVFGIYTAWRIFRGSSKKVAGGDKEIEFDDSGV